MKKITGYDAAGEPWLYPPRGWIWGKDEGIGSPVSLAISPDSSLEQPLLELVTHKQGDFHVVENSITLSEAISLADSLLEWVDSVEKNGQIR